MFRADQFGANSSEPPYIHVFSYQHYKSMPVVHIIHNSKESCLHQIMTACIAYARTYSIIFHLSVVAFCWFSTLTSTQFELQLFCIEL